MSKTLISNIKFFHAVCCLNLFAPSFSLNCSFPVCVLVGVVSRLQQSDAPEFHRTHQQPLSLFTLVSDYLVSTGDVPACFPCALACNFWSGVYFLDVFVWCCLCLPHVQISPLSLCAAFKAIVLQLTCAASYVPVARLLLLTCLPSPRRSTFLLK